MSIKWIGFITFVWIIGMIWGSTFDKQTEDAGTWFGIREESTLEYLMDFRHISYAEDETGEQHFVGFNSNYFNQWQKVILWDFTFLNGGGYEIIRWIFLVPFSIVAILGLLYMFIQLLQGFIHL